MATSGHSVQGSEGSKSWAFRSSAGAGTDQWAGGFYVLGASHWATGGGPQVLGTANVSYAAHAFVVLSVASTDLVIQVTGTSITDAGVRTPTDSEDISAFGLADAFFETSKKWIGQVTFTQTAGTAQNVNFGLNKYWDNNNNTFTLRGLEVTGFAGANDATPEISLFVHSATGWTFVNGAAPTPQPAIATLQGDHATEFQFANAEPFAWKRDNLNTVVGGGGSEGLIWRVQVNNPNSISHATLSVQVASL